MRLFIPKRLIFLITFICSHVSLEANTCVATTSADWSDVVWSGCGGSIPQSGDVVIIPDNLIVSVPSGSSPYGTGTAAPFLTIFIGEGDGDADGATLNIFGRLNLAAGSTLKFLDDGQSLASGPGNSERIRWYDGNSQIASLNGSAVAFSGPIEVTNGTTGPLPVTFSSLTAKTDGQGVSVNWSTATEKDNDYFSIERSRDKENWEVIGTQQGQGNSFATIHYSFTNYLKCSGVSYYRIRQIDFDGNFDYSEIISFDHGALRIEPIIYPNPATTHIKIIGGQEVFIYDSFGQEIDVSQKVRTLPDDLKELDVASLKRGLYHVHTGEVFTTILLH